VQTSEADKNIEEATENTYNHIHYKEYCKDLVAPQAIDIGESRRRIREKLADERYRVC
ncbi:hypothetical protein JTE90_016281, partial [Oedothorax gibbosus]